MKYFILRDDDTNASTPIECLERLYRPFLEKKLPIHLAVIPNVDTTTKLPNGKMEEFLLFNTSKAQTLPITENTALNKYLQSEPLYGIAQHGYRHTLMEFDSDNQEKIISNLEAGLKLFEEAGYLRPKTFIAPQDKISKTALVEIAKRFPIISTNWFERKKIPWQWWPQYFLKKLRGYPHWRVANTLLLSRPLAFITRKRPKKALEEIKRHLYDPSPTVLATHWWEFFDKETKKPNVEMIEMLHRAADLLSQTPGVKVIKFDDLFSSHL